MFREARLKLEWAEQHIDHFDAQCADFFRSGAACTITIHSDAETGDDFVEIAATMTVPDEFALIIGDAIHNLRSALDLAWFEICGADSPDSATERFPFKGPRKQLEAFIRGRPEHQSLAAIADTLLNVIQPYPTGDGELLCHLHKLDILDKHKLLIPQVQILRLCAFFVEDEHGKIHGIKERVFNARRTLTLKHRGSGKIKVKKEGQLSTTVLFGKGTPIPAHIVSPTLRSFSVAVNRVLTILG